MRRFRFYREDFFDAHRDAFGPLTQDVVDALDKLLIFIEQEERLFNSRFIESSPKLNGNTTEQNKRLLIGAYGSVPRHMLAYILATVRWETACTYRPIKEYGTVQYFNDRYGPAVMVGKQLKYCGRGYVRLTGCKNYTWASEVCKSNLLDNPDLACCPEYAWQILIVGMLEGRFTGRSLCSYVNEYLTDFYNARRVVDETDQHVEIAVMAQKFYDILERSVVICASSEKKIAEENYTAAFNEKEYRRRMEADTEGDSENPKLVAMLAYEEGVQQGKQLAINAFTKIIQGAYV